MLKLNHWDIMMKDLSAISQISKDLKQVEKISKDLSVVSQVSGSLNHWEKIKKDLSVVSQVSGSLNHWEKIRKDLSVVSQINESLNNTMFSAINKANTLYNINSLSKNISVSNWATSVMNESAISELLKASEKLMHVDASEKAKKNPEISVELTPITNYISQPIFKEKLKDTLGNELNEEESALIDATLDFKMSPDNLIQLKNSQELRDIYEDYPELIISPTDEDVDIILKKCMLFVVCIIFILSPYSIYTDKILSLYGVYELLLKKMIEKKE